MLDDIYIYFKWIKFYWDAQLKQKYRLTHNFKNMLRNYEL